MSNDLQGNTPTEYNAPPLRGTVPNPNLNAWGELLMAQIFNQLNCHQVGTVATFYPATQTADIQVAMQRLVPDTTSTAQIFNQLNCHQVGTIVNFYPNGGPTADIQVAMQRLVPDTTSTPPQWKARAYTLLQNVPVFVPSGGGGTLTFPVAKGDTCLVLFNDRDLGRWFSTGNTQAVPASGRAHNLSDGLAIVGFRNMANLLTGYSTTDAVLQNGGSSVSLAAKVGIANQSTSLLSVLLAMNTQIVVGGGGSSAGVINSLLK